MPKYVDVENYCDNICRCRKSDCDKVKCPIVTAPTADVAPIIHAAW